MGKIDVNGLWFVLPLTNSLDMFLFVFKGHLASEKGYLVSVSVNSVLNKKSEILAT